jgi:hypothetical protein
MLTTGGVLLLRLGKEPALWNAALCLLFAAFSATATWDVRDHYTGGLNVAEPLIGLGVFGAGMSASPLARRAAAALIAVHRGGHKDELEELPAAIASAAAGELYITPQLMRFLLMAKLGLTRRQEEVAGYLGAGLSNREIAEQMGISEDVVKEHVCQNRAPGRRREAGPPGDAAPPPVRYQSD